MRVVLFVFKNFFDKLKIYVDLLIFKIDESKKILSNTNKK